MVFGSHELNASFSLRATSCEDILSSVQRGHGQGFVQRADSNGRLVMILAERKGKRSVATHFVAIHDSETVDHVT
jgi:hypothetical protein